MKYRRTKLSPTFWIALYFRCHITSWHEAFSLLRPHAA